MKVVLNDERTTACYVCSYLMTYRINIANRCQVFQLPFQSYLLEVKIIVVYRMRGRQNSCTKQNAQTEPVAVDTNKIRYGNHKQLFYRPYIYIYIYTLKKTVIYVIYVYLRVCIIYKFSCCTNA